MRTLLVRVMILSASLLAGTTGCAEKNGCMQTTGQCCKATATAKVLRHVVLFKFKEGTTKEQITHVEDAFRALPGKISAIADFEWGTDVSPEGKAQGFTHCFFLTFRSEADRDAYLPHPAHKEFGSTLRGILDQALVVDYWTQR